MLGTAVSIAANSLMFDHQGFCSGAHSEMIIHPANKDEWDASESIKSTFTDRPYVLLFGDSLEDLKMIEPAVRETAIAIGFCTKSRIHQKQQFLERFDIVVTSDDTDE